MEDLLGLVGRTPSGQRNEHEVPQLWCSSQRRTLDERDGIGIASHQPRVGFITPRFVMNGHDCRQNDIRRKRCQRVPWFEARRLRGGGDDRLRNVAQGGDHVSIPPMISSPNRRPLLRPSHFVAGEFYPWGSEIGDEWESGTQLLFSASREGADRDTTETDCQKTRGRARRSANSENGEQTLRPQISHWIDRSPRNASPRARSLLLQIGRVGRRQTRRPQRPQRCNHSEE